MSHTVHHVSCDYDMPYGQAQKIAHELLLQPPVPTSNPTPFGRNPCWHYPCWPITLSKSTSITVCLYFCLPLP